MRVLPRLRLLFARRPWLRWLVVGLCGSVVAAQLLAAQSALEHERDRWGAVRKVWVAEAAAAAGGPVAVRQQAWPMAVVPDVALAEPPNDPVAARPIAAGQVLTPIDLVGGSALPAGWAVFAVPVDGLPPLTDGQQVSVFAGGTGLCEGRAGGSGQDSVEVAVPGDCAAAFSAALSGGGLVVARRV